MEVNTWERGVWDRTEGGVILVISLGAGSSAQKEWGTRMAAEGLLEVISGEGGTVRMEGAEEAGILGFLGDGEGTVRVDEERTIGAIKLFRSKNLRPQSSNVVFVICSNVHTDGPHSHFRSDGQSL